jgi:hypothetical protein
MRSIEQLYDEGKTGRSVKFELAEVTRRLSMIIAELRQRSPAISSSQGAGPDAA